MENSDTAKIAGPQLIVLISNILRGAGVDHSRGLTETIIGLDAAFVEQMHHMLVWPP